MVLINPYAYGTLALMTMVGRYYHLHDQFIHTKKLSIKKLEEAEKKEQEEKTESENAYKNFRLVCHYFLQGKGLTPHNLSHWFEPSHCSHLVAGYLRVDPETLTLTTEDVGDWESLKVLSGIKRKHGVKVLLSVGDGAGGAISRMVTSWLLRYRFMYSALDILDEYELDGLDFDWEFPGFHGGKGTDRKYFPILLKELKALFKEKDKPFLLSATVPALPGLVRKGFDVPAIAKNVDMVNLMTYDYFYYQRKRPRTAHPNPLFASPFEEKGDTDFNVVWSVDYWALQGMPKYKMNVGISTHARTYELDDPYLHEIRVPARGPGMGKGLITYAEVCDFLRSGAKSYLDGYGQVPFAFKGRQWVAYEDPLSVTLKAVWSREVGCGGVSTFSLNTDDWSAICDGTHKFPLHRAIWRAIKKGW